MKVPDNELGGWLNRLSGLSKVLFIVKFKLQLVANILYCAVLS